MRLGRVGGDMATGLSPLRWLLDDLRGTVDRLGLNQRVDIYVAEYRGDAGIERVVERAWDLRALQEMYRAFLRERAPVRDALTARHEPMDPRQAFVDYMAVQAQWRRLPLLDPGLPASFLPPDWAGFAAAELFFALRDLLDPAALAHVRAVTRQ